MDRKDKTSAKGSRKSVIKLKKKLKERSLHQSTELCEASENIHSRKTVKDRKDKTSAKGSRKSVIKLKKKLKERSLHQSTELCEASENTHSRKTVKEDKPMKTKKGKKMCKLSSKRVGREKRLDVDANNDHLSHMRTQREDGNNYGGGKDRAEKSIQTKMCSDISDSEKSIKTKMCSDISDSAKTVEEIITTEPKREKRKIDDKRGKDHLITEESKIDESQNEVDAESVNQILSLDKNTSKETTKRSKRDSKRKRKGLYIDKGGKLEDSQNEVDVGEVDEISQVIEVKNKKYGKRRRKDLGVVKEMKMKESQNEDARNVDQISSVDEDCSRGMKKWLIEYKESRPGLQILKQRVDEFITSYEEKLEQEKKEREARVAADGWTVVAHHKGRKKTTDSESGITVGSVAPAAVMDNKVKKKNTEVLPDFYRFQKREAQRNEVMMLQSKFEQDKKRIQQLRAERKFRPY